MESKAMERNKTSHVAQIEAHVRMEAAQDLHDELVAMRSGYAKLYGLARGILGVMAIHGDIDPETALKELDTRERELFPEDLEFTPARYYGEGKNE
jgi:hypothetical protein